VLNHVSPVTGEAGGVAEFGMNAPRIPVGPVGPVGPVTLGPVAPVGPVTVEAAPIPPLDRLVLLVRLHLEYL
jgi:hypothetical protein